MRPLVTAILSRHLSDIALNSLLTLLGPEGDRLVDLWQRCGLFVATANSTSLSLTPNGSWLTGNMLLQLEDAFARCDIFEGATFRGGSRS
jgi:hypothetical protein